MKPLIILLFAVSIVLISILMVSAEVGKDDRGNPNDPAVNERANACYEGASLAGKCDTEEMWVAGWYLIRFETGLIGRDEFPDQYDWLLPPVVESVPGQLTTTPPPK
jgi:hypothetical protein